MRMRIHVYFTAFFLLAVPATAQQDDVKIAPEIGENIAQNFAGPGLAAFAGASGALVDAVSHLCSDPDTQNLSSARAAFAQAVSAWGRASVLRFGPLQADNRFERIFFWPDPRGVTLRQVQGVLAAKEEAAITAESLAGRSIALQGFPALDYILFGTGSDALTEREGAYRCDYGRAVAGNLAMIAGNTAEGWREGTEFHDSLTAPAAGRNPYRSSAEVAAEVVKAAGTALQFIRNAELLPAMGESAQKSRGKRAPFWRSESTFNLVAAQIEGVKALIEAAGFTTSPSEDVQALTRSMFFDLDHALAAIEAIAVPPEQAFADEQARSRLAYAALALEGANRTLNEGLSGALGLVMGFNALDGD